MQIALESVVTGSRRLPSVLPARRAGGVGLHRYELEMNRNESLRSGARLSYPTRNFATLGPFSLLRSRFRETVPHFCETLCIAAEDGLYHSPTSLLGIWRIVSEDSPHAFKISSSRYFLFPPSFISLRSLRISVIP